MRKKISISLLIMVVVIAFGLYICSFSILIGILAILGAIVSEFMYLITMTEPDEVEYWEELRRIEKENKDI